ncbi:MAG: DUF1003 domain-containing protein [Solirubrobacteraceae bacterium]
MARRDDLSKPRGTPGGPQYDPDAFGRFAESIARYLGTGRYLAIQTVLVIVWILINVAAVALRFDPYPFILLNLMFSTQAAYAAPLILLAQNRQADRDRAETERDREVNARALADADYLAREIAALRISIEHKADRDDIADAVRELTLVAERIGGAISDDDADEAFSERSDDLLDPSG